MRFLIIGDLHGKKPHVRLKPRKDFDAIIAPGDFCLDSGIRDIYQKFYAEFLKNPNTKKEWWDYCGKKKAKDLVLESVKRGRDILAYLDSFDVPVYIIPGNWDMTKGQKTGWSFMDKDFYKKYVLKGHKNVFDVHSRMLDVGDYVFVGYGICNGPELLKYRGYDGMNHSDIEKNKRRFEKQMRKYDSLFRRARSRRKPMIFLSHNMPFNTKLDIITNKKSLRDGSHYGSLIARNMILRHKPLVCIGGHMHEHFGKDMLGKTTIINAGFGPDVYSILALDARTIKSLRFVDPKGAYKSNKLYK